MQGGTGQGGNAQGGNANVVVQVTQNPTIIQQVQQVERVFVSDQQAPAQSIGQPTFTPQASETDNFQVVDEALHLNYHTPGAPYTGSVPGITSEYINANATNLDVTSLSPNTFIKTGSGNDNLSAFSGRNVLDGGAGSNIFTAGTGQDTMIMETASSTDTKGVVDLIKNFAKDDEVILRGITPSGFVVNTADTIAAGGPVLAISSKSNATGLSTAIGIAGYSAADLNSGKLSLTFSTDPTTNTPYMLIHANG